MSPPDRSSGTTAKNLSSQNLCPTTRAKSLSRLDPSRRPSSTVKQVYPRLRRSSRRALSSSAFRHRTSIWVARRSASTRKSFKPWRKPSSKPAAWSSPSWRGSLSSGGRVPASATAYPLTRCRAGSSSSRSICPRSKEAERRSRPVEAKTSRLGSRLGRCQLTGSSR